MRPGSFGWLMVLAMSSGCLLQPLSMVVFDLGWRFGPGATTPGINGNSAYDGGFETGIAGMWTVNLTSRVENGTILVRIMRPSGMVQLDMNRDGEQAFEGGVGVWRVQLFAYAPYADPQHGARQDPAIGQLRVRITTLA